MEETKITKTTCGRKKGSILWNKGLKINIKPWNKGLTKQTDIRVLQNSNSRIGQKRTSEAKLKMSNTRKKLFKEGKLKPIKYWLNKKNIKQNEKMKGRKLSINHKQKLRETRIKYIKNVVYIKFPCIGKHEKQILDEIELSNNIKIIRQFLIIGYWLDGYCKKLNIAFEIDEKFHKNKPEKDKEREKNIKKELNCQFIRIADYDKEVYT